MIQVNAATRLLASFNPSAIAKDMAKLGKKETNSMFISCIQWFAAPANAKKYKGQTLSAEEFVELFRAAAKKIPNSAYFLKCYDAGKPGALEAARIGGAMLYDVAAVKKAMTSSGAPDAAVDPETALKDELDQITKKRATLLKKWGYKPDYDGAFSDAELNVLDPLHMKEVKIRKQLSKF